MEEHRHLGRVRQRHADDVAVYEHAGRRCGAGDRNVADVKSGKNKIFAGPIKDQSGTVKVAEGTTMDDNALAHMQWLAAGWTAS